MKSFIKYASLFSASFVFVVGVFGATSTEESYIASYKGRTDVPVPVSIVAPKAATDSEALVTLEFVVSKDGAPEKLAVKSSTDSDLDAAALDAVAQWKFEPKKLNGTAVASKVVLPVHFVAAD